MNIETVALSNGAPEAFQRERETPKGDPAPRSTSVSEHSLTTDETSGQAGGKSRILFVAEPDRARESASDAREEKRLDNALVDRLAKQPRFKLSFRIDEATQKVVITVIDPETKDVIRQVPPEEILRLAEKLDSARGSLVSSKV